MKMEWIVSQQESGLRLVAFLHSKLGPSYSGRQIKRAIEHNCCRVNQLVERFASLVLGKGDRVAMELSLLVNKAPEIHMHAEHILYEDEFIFIYNKPSGISSDAMGIVKLVHEYHPHLRLAHRLDRDTTGAILFAKSKNVLQEIIHLFHHYRVFKSYLAIVDGVPEKAFGSIENYLGRLHDYEGQAIWGEVPKPKGVYSRTDWNLEASGNLASLIACYPKTGRTHQIRVHMHEMGHSILGDYQYARRFRCPLSPERYLLHAAGISFPHPITKELISISAPLPEDFKHAWQSLQGTPNRWITE